jgi:hypothetical protein
VSPESSSQAFDLNIEKVVDGWAVADAVREFIANALDERHLTGTAAPEVARRGAGMWKIEDFGRGLQYHHLTQNENAEKRKHSAVIGHGIGLKDALAVCDRRKIRVVIWSRFTDITIQHRPKAGFDDVPTLHAIISPPTEPERVGTVIELSNIRDEDIDAAKSLFLLFAGDEVLEATKYGSVLANRRRKRPAASTSTASGSTRRTTSCSPTTSPESTGRSAKALNWERHNVARCAYSERVKQILKECESAEVADALATDLSRFSSGRIRDQLESMQRVREPTGRHDHFANARRRCLDVCFAEAVAMPQIVF